MDSLIITITLPPDLAKRIDEAARANYISRSQFIRQSIVLRLNNQRIIKEQSTKQVRLKDKEIFDL